MQRRVLESAWNPQLTLFRGFFHLRKEVWRTIFTDFFLHINNSHERIIAIINKIACPAVAAAAKWLKNFKVRFFLLLHATPSCCFDVSNKHIILFSSLHYISRCADDRTILIPFSKPLNSKNAVSQSSAFILRLRVSREINVPIMFR